MKKIKIAVQLKDSISGKILVPVPEDEKKLRAYINNQILYVEIKGSISPRSLQQLRLYFGCCGKVAMNTPFPSEKDVDEYVKLNCHFIEYFYDHLGNRRFRTKSISYENCDQPDFNQFMDDALPVMADILGCTVKQLIDSLNDL